MKDTTAGYENMATGTLIQGRAMERLRSALFDPPATLEGLEFTRREFIEDLRCALEHFRVGFDQLTGELPSQRVTEGGEFAQ